MKHTEARRATAPRSAVPACPHCAGMELELQDAREQLAVLRSDVEVAERAAKDALREQETAREHCTGLYDFAPNAYVTLDRNGFIRDANLAAERLLREDRTELRGALFMLFVAKKDRRAYLRHLSRCRRSLYPTMVATDLSLICGNGQRAVHVLSTPDRSPQQFRYRTALVDLSENRRAEQSLRDSEARYRLLFELNPCPMYILDENTLDFLDVNKAALGLYGYSREAFLAMTFKDIRPQEDASTFMADIRRQLRLQQRAADRNHPSARHGASRKGGNTSEGIPLPAGEWRHVKRDGTMFDAAITVSSIHYAGRGARLVLINDITARKQAEDALRKSEEQLRAIVSSTPDHIIVQDRELRYLFVANPQLGFSVEDVIGKTDHDLVSLEQADKLTAIKRQVIETGNTVHLEIPITNANGQTEYFEGSYIPMFDANGRPNGLIGYFRNVTGRKQAEESLRKLAEELEQRVEARTAALRENVERLNTILMAAHVIAWELDPITGALSENGPVADIFGKPEGFRHGNYATFLEDVHPDDRTRVQTELKTAMQGDIGYHSSQFRLLIPGGDVRWVKISGSIERDAAGRPVRLRGITRDITTRKLARKALRESESRFRAVFEHAAIGMLLVDPKGRVVESNPAFDRMLGYNAKELQGKHFSAFTHPNDLKDAWRMVNGARARRNGRYLIEKRYIRKDGKAIQIRLDGTLVRDETGRPLIGIALVDDITERKQVEFALAQTHRALKVLTACDHALLRGSSEEELLREACRIAVEVGDYRMAWVGYAENDARKSVRPMALVGLAKGYLSRVSVTWADDRLGRGPVGTAIRTGRPSLCRDISNDPLFAPWRKEAMRRGCASLLALPLVTEQRCIGALAIYSAHANAFSNSEIQLLQQLANDLSFGIMALRGRKERRELEQQVLDISEREQRRIGQDLHDGVGQSLAGIRYLISAVQQTLAGKSASEAAELERIAQILGKTVQQTHDLARGLFPGELRRGEIADALRELAVYTQEVFGVSCRLTGLTDVRLTDANVASQLYRIAQEAVTNAAKHSKTKTVDVHLSQKRGRLALTVRDMGIGLPRTAGNHTGMGQRIMKYRADMIGATLKIKSACGKGTTVTCVLPSPPPPPRPAPHKGKGGNGQ